MATPTQMQKLMSPHLRTELISHTRRVCTLYKRMIRDQYWKNDDLLDARFKILQTRAEFDKNKGIKDTRKAKMLLMQAEQDFINTMHPYMKAGQEILPFTKDTGIAYGRYEEFPDYVMDHYHPLEKSIWPKYFAKRELMKKDYLEMWKKKETKSTVKEPHGGGH